MNNRIYWISSEYKAYLLKNKIVKYMANKRRNATGVF